MYERNQVRTLEYTPINFWSRCSIYFLFLLNNRSAKGSLKYGYQSRVLMTGTPLQNNTQELWTLLNFIEPSLFRSLEEFETNYGNMANRDQVESLQRKISPFMLRRVSIQIDSIIKLCMVMCPFNI